MCRTSCSPFVHPGNSTYRATMRRKLGLQKADEGAADDALVAELLKTMEETGADWTNTFRRSVDAGRWIVLDA